MSNKINILAISGSLRPDSSNSSILRVIGNMIGDDATYTIYDAIDKLPHFNPSLDNDDANESFNTFRKELSNADGVIICTPEYAFGVPGVLKNALDWTVSSGNFDKKPTAVITASLAGDKAHASILLTFKALGANIPEDGTLLIPFVRTRVSSKGEITDAGTLEALKTVADALLQAVRVSKKQQVIENV